MGTTTKLTMTAWLVGATILAAPAANAAESVEMDTTGLEADARGKTTFSPDSASGARFVASVRRLTPEADYHLVVDGIRVHSLRTSSGGRAKVKFSSEPRNERTVMLGFDPTGKSVHVQTMNGDDVLTATMPGQPAELTACCVSDGDGSTCESRTADDCQTAGGTLPAAASCLPDPCGSAPPVDRDVVCCVHTEAGPECVARTVSECADGGGSVVEADSCTPNPCVVVPPPTCAESCWASFYACLAGCSTTYCAPYCQVDLGRCLDVCPPE